MSTEQGLASTAKQRNNQVSHKNYRSCQMSAQGLSVPHFIRQRYEDTRIT